MQYSIPYIAVIASLLIFSALQLGIKLNDRSQRLINAVVVLIFIVFIGLRGFVSTDWKDYAPLFNKLPNIFNIWSGISQYKFDSGFVIYTSIIKTFTSNYHVYIFINTVIDIILLNIFFRRYLDKKYYPFFIALYLVYFGMIFEINLLRNVKSLLLFLLSLKYLEDRDWKKYFLLNILGLAFHWTALLFFPLYFFMHHKMHLRTFMILFLIGNILYLLQMPYIKSIILLVGRMLGGIYEYKLTIYVNNEIYGRMAALSFGYFERTILAFIVMFYYDKFLERSKSNVIFVNAFIIFVLLALFTREIEIGLTRFCALFAFSIWILIPKLIEMVQVKLKMIFFISFSLILLAKIYLLTNNDILFQYDNVLFGDMKSYQERYIIYKENIDRILRKQ